MKRFGILACILACGLVAGCTCNKCDDKAAAAPAAMSAEKGDCCSKDKASMGAMGAGSSCSSKASMGAMGDKAACSKGDACCKVKAAATQN